MLQQNTYLTCYKDPNVVLLTRIHFSYLFDKINLIFIHTNNYIKLVNVFALLKRYYITNYICLKSAV